MFPHRITRAAVRAAALALVASATAAAPALADPSASADQSTSAPATLQSVAATAGSAFATAGDASGCVAPALTQPFLAWHDQNEYTLAPGESVDSFDGTGWTLGGGASIDPETLADGQTGQVLDIPSGGYAVSPPMCVDSIFSDARTMVRTSGGALIGVGVSYASGAGSSLQLSGVLAGSGSGSGFTLSQPLQVHPGNLPGWQIVQFVFATTGSGGDGQIYNFYVDPRMLR